MSEKDEVNVTSSPAYRLLHPMHTVLVSCIGKDGKLNIITLAWATPTSINPPLVALSIVPLKDTPTTLLKKQRSSFLIFQQ